MFLLSWLEWIIVDLVLLILFVLVMQMFWFDQSCKNDKL